MLWTVLLGFGTGRERTLAGLRRTYQWVTGKSLVPSSFYDRFSTELAQMFRAVLSERSSLVDRTWRARAMIAPQAGILLDGPGWLPALTSAQHRLRCLLRVTSGSWASQATMARNPFGFRISTQ